MAAHYKASEALSRLNAGVKLEKAKSIARMMMHERPVSAMGVLVSAAMQLVSYHVKRDENKVHEHILKPLGI